MAQTSWKLQEAKARLSELVNSAQVKGPQQITVHGKPAVVVMSCMEYVRLTENKSSFVEFLRRSPLHGISVTVTRNPTLTRPINSFSIGLR